MREWLWIGNVFAQTRPIFCGNPLTDTEPTPRATLHQGAETIRKSSKRIGVPAKGMPQTPALPGGSFSDSSC